MWDWTQHYSIITLHRLQYQFLLRLFTVKCGSKPRVDYFMYLGLKPVINFSSCGFRPTVDYLMFLGLNPEFIYLKSMGPNPEINFSYCGFKPRFHYFKSLDLDPEINKLGSRSDSSKFNSSSTKGSTLRVFSKCLLEPGACYYNCNATTTTHHHHKTFCLNDQATNSLIHFYKRCVLV